MYGKNFNMKQTSKFIIMHIHFINLSWCDEQNRSETTTTALLAEALAQRILLAATVALNIFSSFSFGCVQLNF